MIWTWAVCSILVIGSFVRRVHQLGDKHVWWHWAFAIAMLLVFAPFAAVAFLADLTLRRRKK